MKKLYISTILLIIVMAATAVIAQTRRERSDEFVRKTINIEETETLSSTIKACDPDGDPLILVIDDLPEGATLSNTYIIPPEPDINDPNCVDCYADPNSTSWYGADLTWTPTYQQQGEYRLHVHAEDDKGGDDWVVIIINVANKNRPPFL